MSFDLAPILLVAFCVTGGIVLIDKLFLKKARGLGQTPWFSAVAKEWFPLIAFVFVLRSFIVEPFQIPSGSMEPTLLKGDFLLVNKFAYGVRLPVFKTKIIPIGTPERGDVMIFVPPHRPEYFIKRVIGLPGDRIRIRNNKVWVNGEEYVQTEFKGTASQQVNASNYGFEIRTEITGDTEHQIQVKKGFSRLGYSFDTVVSEGHYFMMGDSRDNSVDSRKWGEVPESNIVGRAWVKWMFWENWASIPSFHRTGKIQ